MAGQQTDDLGRRQGFSFRQLLYLLLTSGTAASPLNRLRPRLQLPLPYLWSDDLMGIEAGRFSERGIRHSIRSESIVRLKVTVATRPSSLTLLMLAGRYPLSDRRISEC